MSEILRNSLKDRLEKLECHFTWNLREEDVDIDNVEERLNDQIIHFSDANTHRMYNMLAYLEHLKGDHDEALLQLQKAEAQIAESSISEDKDVKRVVMYGNFAWVYYHQNQFIQSSTYAEKVQDILQNYDSPAKKPTLQLDIYGEQGWIYLSFTGKYYPQAKECFEKALELNPENPELNLGYAITVYRMEDFAFLSNPENKSLPLLERAVILNPSDTMVKVLLALKYHDLKNNKQATIIIEQALQEQPENPHVLRYVAMFYKRRGEIENAIKILMKAARLTPTSSAIHYQLAKCYKILMIRKYNGRDNQPNYDATPNAIFHSEKAVELNKSFVAARMLLTDLYIKAGEYLKAEEEFGKTLAMNNISSQQKQEIHLIWAKYLLNAGKSEVAVNHFKEVIEIQNQTWFRDTAIKELKGLAKSMINQNPMDATGQGLLDYIHQKTRQDF